MDPSALGNTGVQPKFSLDQGYKAHPALWAGGGAWNNLWSSGQGQSGRVPPAVNDPDQPPTSCAAHVLSPAPYVTQSTCWPHPCVLHAARGIDLSCCMCQGWTQHRGCCRQLRGLIWGIHGMYLLYWLYHTGPVCRVQARVTMEPVHEASLLQMLHTACTLDQPLVPRVMRVAPGPVLHVTCSTRQIRSTRHMWYSGLVQDPQANSLGLHGPDL